MTGTTWECAVLRKTRQTTAGAKEVLVRSIIAPGNRSSRAVTALAYTVEFVWYLVQSFQRGFQAFFLLFPILEGLLMIAIFVGLVKITLDTRDAKKWGLGITAAAFAAMLLVVGTAFAGWFKDAGEVNYFVFLERIALIPLGIFFGRMMEGEEPILTIDLKKNSDGEDGGPETQAVQTEPERTGTEDAPE